ncbi:hypothetical protein FXF51_56935 [Nonomuraea sp. PA05]|uniref:hypothetical protein n=1 Tax=Nonomuraea sp. PA05 TaxID=2604466 RepID=UPI0011D4B42D|nr:hypothetical protein [Nonomuraea sp. PA05]TYB50267.1 hypothetical protein FXF51_56935 [Nonomuraea sp. PA05]
MTFDELRPGQLARISDLHERLGDPPPPVVRIELHPCPCSASDCDCWIAFGRDIETGRLNPYHRRPNFAVTVITPAHTPPKEAA